MSLVEQFENSLRGLEEQRVSRLAWLSIPPADLAAAELRDAEKADAAASEECRLAEIDVDTTSTALGKANASRDSVRAKLAETVAAADAERLVEADRVAAALLDGSTPAPSSTLALLEAQIIGLQRVLGPLEKGIGVFAEADRRNRDTLAAALTRKEQTAHGVILAAFHVAAGPALAAFRAAIETPLGLAGAGDARLRSTGAPAANSYAPPLKRIRNELSKWLALDERR